jgi:hypothetical protein
MVKKRKTYDQISVKLSPKLHARLQTACEIQQHKEGQLCRILIEWSLPFYQLCRSVERLQMFTAIPHPEEESQLKIRGEEYRRRIEAEIERLKSEEKNSKRLRYSNDAFSVERVKP